MSLRASSGVIVVCASLPELEDSFLILRLFHSSVNGEDACNDTASTLSTPPPGSFEEGDVLANLNGICQELEEPFTISPLSWNSRVSLRVLV